MRAFLLAALLALACSAMDELEGGAPEGGKADDPGAGGARLGSGRYEAAGGPGKTGALEIFAGSDRGDGRFYAELDDFCLGPRCLSGLTACGSYLFDGDTVRFRVSQYFTADGDVDQEDHRTTAAYTVAPEGEGTFRLTEVIEDQRAVQHGNDQVIHRTGEAVTDIDARCPGPLHDPAQDPT